MLPRTERGPAKFSACSVSFYHLELTSVSRAVARSVLSGGRGGAAAGSATARRWRSFRLLPLQLVVERGLLNGDLILISLWIDERVRPAWFQQGVLLRHAIHRRMRPQWHVDVRRVQVAEALF